MKCPTCNVNLVMAERSGIEIDYCPECRGVWLDRGELDKIIERSIPETNTKSRPAEQHNDRPHYSREDEYKYKNKKSLLGDLFDF